MTTQKELSRINRLVEIILKEGTISKVQLVMKSGISISYYEKLKPFIEEIYPHKVRYDKITKNWLAIKSEEIMSETELVPNNAVKLQDQM
jgi:hypothetical protein